MSIGWYHTAREIQQYTTTERLLRASTRELGTFDENAHDSCRGMMLKATARRCNLIRVFSERRNGLLSRGAILAYRREGRYQRPNVRA
ncbi:MAG: hypothetical protein J07HQX50_02586, partial [Haloquadratum sp. J07HQX50]